MLNADRLEAAEHLSSPRYLYEHVTSELRREISSGGSGPGTKLPTHKTLAKQFGVSAITVRRAINDLILEGLLVGHQGIGVFVKDQRRIVRSLGAASTVSFADDIRRAGFKPGIRQLNYSLVRAPKDVLRRLNVRSGSHVYRQEKLILSDGDPICREITYLPQRIGKRVEAELSKSFIFSLLTSHGIEIDHIDFRVEGAAASESDASLLNIKIGGPLINAHYLLIGPNNSPIAMGSIVSRSDRVAFDLCSRPESATQKGSQKNGDQASK